MSMDVRGGISIKTIIFNAVTRPNQTDPIHCSSFSPYTDIKSLFSKPPPSILA